MQSDNQKINSIKRRHTKRTAAAGNPLLMLLLTLAFPLMIYLSLIMRGRSFGFQYNLTCFYLGLDFIVVGLAWSVSEVCWLFWGLPEKAIHLRFKRQTCYGAAVILASALIVEISLCQEEYEFRKHVKRMQNFSATEDIVAQLRRWPNSSIVMCGNPDGQYTVYAKSNAKDSAVD